MLLHELLLLGTAFNLHGWPLEGQPPYPDLFENFARLLARLSPQERALCFKLLTDYRWVTERERTAMLLAAWATFEQMVPKRSRIWLAPLAKPNSRSPKSSDAVWKTLGENVAWLRRSGLTIKLMKSAIRGRNKRTVDDILLLVDDFIGTGETAASALASVRVADPSRTRYNTFILVMSAQSAAIARLSGECRIVAQELAVKCISDRFPAVEVQSELTTACGIGRRLGFKKGERLGYGDCESLITLARTPNNTLPMFWTNRKVKGQTWPAPFPRENDRAM